LDQNVYSLFERSIVSFLMTNWVLVTLAVGSGLLLVWPVLQGTSGVSLQATDAVQTINRDKAVVVDVCEPAEYAQGHVRNATNVPLGQLESDLAKVVKDKAQPVIFVCAAGARSLRATSVAKKLGYEQVYSLQGGLKAWKEANLPVAKA
jgi:rhodanese-related sulfurtransferase